MDLVQEMSPELLVFVLANVTAGAARPPLQAGGPLLYVVSTAVAAAPGGAPRRDVLYFCAT